MKKLVFPLVIIAIAFGIYEQTKTNPNIFVLIIVVIVFMYGMMRLSAKTPSKNVDEIEEIEENEENDK